MEVVHYHDKVIRTNMYYARRSITMQNVTVRRSASGDESSLARLAALDSASPPRGPALIAEANSRMLAALPLGAGRPIADPFEPTAELVALLELRRKQIGSANGATRRPSRLRSLFRGRPSHARA
jgi:hypothetical protein